MSEPTRAGEARVVPFQGAHCALRTKRYAGRVGVGDSLPVAELVKRDAA